MYGTLAVPLFFRRNTGAVAGCVVGAGGTAGGGVVSGGVVKPASALDAFHSTLTGPTPPSGALWPLYGGGKWRTSINLLNLFKLLPKNEISASLVDILPIKTTKNNVYFYSILYCTKQ